MSEWVETTLGEVADLCLGKMLDQKKNQGTFRPYLNNVAVRWGAFDLKDLPAMRFLDKELERYGVRKGDIVACEGGEPGRCAIWQNEEPILIQKALHRIRVHEGVDNRFVYYQFRYRAKRGEFDRFMTGSTIKHLPGEALAKLPITLPPLSTQRRIAAVLSALDDKIELNNRINANLEAQAQALFRSWFVDFGPWGGERPEGWREGCLLDIADYCNGLAMQKFRPQGSDKGLPVLKIRELRQGEIDPDSEKCTSALPDKVIVDDGDVVFSWSGSLLVDIWCGGRGGLNQHLFKVTSEKYPKWFYYLWTKHHLDRFVAIAANMATTMGHIKRDELEKAEVAIPDAVTLDRCSLIMAPMVDAIKARRGENRTLAALRDTLLPKLMSGEIDVSLVEIPA